MRTPLVLIAALASAPLQAQSPWETEIWAGYGQIMTDWFAVSEFTIKDGETILSRDSATDLQGLGVRAGMRARQIGAEGMIMMLGGGASWARMEPASEDGFETRIDALGAYGEGGVGYVLDAGLEVMLVAGLGLEQITGAARDKDVSGLALARRAGLDVGWNFERALLSVGAHTLDSATLEDDPEISYTGRVYTGSLVFWF